MIRTNAKIPYAITDPSRIPARRYYDQAFYDLECQTVWKRTWQMACRLEEIPKVGDYVEYKILDQSIIVVRAAEDRIKAYYNSCRHRGMKLVKDRGSAKQGFSCPFHGWRFNLEGENSFLYQPDLFTEANRNPNDLKLRECRVETWGGFAFINMDDKAPPLYESMQPFAKYHDDRHVGQMKLRWWYSAIVPANWKLAQEAFMEGYHVMRTHPQMIPKGSALTTVYKPKTMGNLGNNTTNMMLMDGGGGNKVVEHALHYMDVSVRGMDSMTLPRERQIAEKLKGNPLPDNPAAASDAWMRMVAKAVTDEYRKSGIDSPDYLDLMRTTTASVQFCFPNFFLLPTYGNMASYRFRPLGPESTLFELWSISLYPPGEEPKEPIKTPEPMGFNNPRWPEIPPQDFSNVPMQQEGVHCNGFEFMRLSHDVEGLVSHFEQTVDGYIAGLEHKDLLHAQHVGSGSIDVAIKEKFFEIDRA